MPKTASNPLMDRLDALGITAAEVAQIVKRPVELVEEWINTGPDTEGVVLLRFLADEADALRRVNHLRRTHQGDLRGAGMNYAGIEGVPYGTSDIEKITGGVS